MRKFLVCAMAIGAAILGALALASYALASTSTRAAPATTAKATASVPRCTAAALGVWVAADQSEGAAGTFYYPLEFTNISGHTCSMHGYPGVSAIGQNGVQLGSPAAWAGIAGATVRTVTLVPGATAHAVLAYSNAIVGNSRSVPAAELRVYPPNQFEATAAFWSLRSLTVKGRTYMRVGPVEAGIGLRGNG